MSRHPTWWNKYDCEMQSNRRHLRWYYRPTRSGVSSWQTPLRVSVGRNSRRFVQPARFPSIVSPRPPRTPKRRKSRLVRSPCAAPVLLESILPVVPFASSYLPDELLVHLRARHRRIRHALLAAKPRVGDAFVVEAHLLGDRREEIGHGDAIHGGSVADVV